MSDIAIVLGRGIEGCGVTKYTVELESWLLKKGHDVTVYSTKDKKWSRNDVHELKNLVHVRFDRDEFDQVYEGCKKSDLMIIISLPSVGHSEKCRDNFLKLLNLSMQKVSIQLDHYMASLKRNLCLYESVKNVDLVFALSTTGAFSEYVKTNVDTEGSLSTFWGDEEVKKTIHGTQAAVDFDSYKKYKKPISEQDERHHKWIGRTARWKGYGLMIDFHNEHLSGLDHMTTIEGIDRSPVYMEVKDKYSFKEEIKTKIEDCDLSNRYGELASLFGIYNNSELLERMSLCGYGYQLSILEPHMIGSHLEFTHLELVAVGAIPVFRKEYGDACIHRYYKKPLTEIESGTIWLSENNMEECLETIKNLSKDENMRKEYRDKAQKCYQWYDSKYVFEDVFKIINGV